MSPFSQSPLDLEDEIIVVSGLPRSGTSMMMAMLEVGGISLLTDGERQADEDNPKGYYEFERVKKLSNGDFSWLSEAKGRAVKIISYLLMRLPDVFSYRVIFIHRNVDEILASQKKMLTNRGEDPEKFSQEEMKGVLVRHLEQVDEWIEGQSNITRIDIDYNKMLEDPEGEVDRLRAFLAIAGETEELIKVIDPRLYRHRVGG
jgi:hypothetical protein